MSIECSECEWDARAGHDPDCSRSPEKKLDALRAENERLTEEVAHWRRTTEAARVDTTEALAENERLRAALEKIEAGYGQRLSAAELASMARQAL